MRPLFMLALTSVWFLACEGATTMNVCGPKTCDGCCQDGVCKTGLAKDACGGQGEVCAKCGTGRVCNLGICVVQNTDGGMQTTDAGSDCERTCMGCCNNGQCLAGKSAQACGESGAACVTCGSNQYCAKGECAGSSCGPSNCSGCCLQGQCITGSSSGACGMGGAACSVCATGQTCSNGTCLVGTCDPSNCNGCCKNGRCEPGATVAACGSAGATCGQCTTQQTCMAGACVTSTCGPTTCPDGCCSGGICVVQPNALACGIGGGSCSPCASSQICMNGTCVAPPCGPGTCGGCCDGSGSCTAGNSPSACGHGGQACLQGCTTCNNGYCNDGSFGGGAGGGSASSALGDSCLNPMSASGPINGLIQNYTLDLPGGSGCGALGYGPEAVYAVTIPPGTVLHANATPSLGWDLSLSLMLGTCGSTCSAGSDNATNGGTETLTWYNDTGSTQSAYIAVSGYGAANGSFTGSITVDSLAIGERCESPLVIAVGSYQTGNLSSANADYVGPLSCGGGGGGFGGDLVYSVVVYGFETLTVDVLPSLGLDTSVFLTSSVYDCNHGGCLTSNNSGGFGAYDTVSWTNLSLSSQTVYIVVSTYAGSGSFAMAVSGRTEGDSCNVLNCAGCCYDGFCFSGDSIDYCGSNGSYCDICDSYCLLGTCF